ncbi:MAG: vitamin B12 dependent-methionine synthase activation domain-containing protein, partial [Desulfobacterales bacterium]
NTCSDLIENYYLDCIGNLALTLVQKQLKKHLQSKFALEKLSFMAPGSLSDWPIEEQEPLFGLLGDVEASIGVRLTRNLLMMPAKSISGLYFPTEVSFYSCQLCPRKRCESRKAKYNEALAGKYGIQNQT